DGRDAAPRRGGAGRRDRRARRGHRERGAAPVGSGEDPGRSLVHRAPTLVLPGTPIGGGGALAGSPPGRGRGRVPRGSTAQPRERLGPVRSRPESARAGQDERRRSSRGALPEGVGPGGCHADLVALLGACRRNARARAMRRVQRRGGARGPHARGTPCTLSVRPRAPRKPMGPYHRSRLAFEGPSPPARGRGQGEGGASEACVAEESELKSRCVHVTRTQPSATPEPVTG